MRCLEIDLVTGKETWEAMVQYGNHAKPYMQVFHRYDHFPTPVWKANDSRYGSQGMEGLRDQYISLHLRFEKI